MQSCHNCGSPVTSNFARVFGSNSNEVYACPSCAPYTALMTGIAASPAGEAEEQVT